MSQTEDGKITKEDIVNYVDRMEIKKASIGGFDKIDVYFHIQELIKMYGIYKEQEMNTQKQTIEAQSKEMGTLKAEKKNAEERLAAQMKHVCKLKDEIELQKEQSADLGKYKEDALHLQREIEELKKYQTVAMELQNETDRQKEEIEELKRYQISAMELQNETDRQKEEIEELKKYQISAMELQNETDRQKEEIEELKKYQISAMELQNEVNGLKKELEEQQTQFELYQLTAKEEFTKKMQEQLREAEFSENEPAKLPEGTEESDEESAGNSNECPSVSEELQNRIREQEQIILQQERQMQSMIQELESKKEELEKNIAESSDPHRAADDIGKILREARREGQNIIDNAKIESEQEMIKLLKLRARFKLEEEKYRNWCERAETEKEAVDEFLKQLSVQYAQADRTLNEVKEKAGAFDIKRIYRAIGNIQGGIGEPDNEEQDS